MPLFDFSTLEKKKVAIPEEPKPLLISKPKKEPTEIEPKKSRKAEYKITIEGIEYPATSDSMRTIYFLVTNKTVRKEGTIPEIAKKLASAFTSVSTI